MGMKLNKVCQWEVLNKIYLKTVFQFLDPRFIEHRIIRIIRIMFFLVVSELYL